METHQEWRENYQETSQTGSKDQHVADSVAHDGYVVQGFADDHIAVIGHGSQKKKIQLPLRE
jgi:hypothetical protein